MSSKLPNTDFLAFCAFFNFFLLLLAFLAASRCLMILFFFCIQPPQVSLFFLLNQHFKLFPPPLILLLCVRPLSRPHVDLRWRSLIFVNFSTNLCWYNCTALSFAKISKWYLQNYILSKFPILPPEWKYHFKSYKVMVRSTCDDLLVFPLVFINWKAKINATHQQETILLKTLKPWPMEHFDVNGFPAFSIKTTYGRWTHQIWMN